MGILDFFKPNVKKIVAKGDFKVLIELLTHHDPRVRYEVVSELKKVEVTKAMRLLTQALRMQGEVATLAAKALGEIGDAQAVEPLIRALSKKDDVRAGAAHALMQIGEPAVESLIKYLKNKNEDVREGVAKVLEEMGWEPQGREQKIAYLIALKRWEQLVKLGEEAVKPIIKVLTRGGDIGVEATSALIHIGEPAVEPLIEVLKDWNWSDDVRCQAAEVLGKIGDARAVEPLIKALKYRSACIRKRAAWAFEKIVDERGTESLIKAFNDKDEHVRKFVEKALENIKAEKMPKQVEPKRKRQPARYKCNFCKALQADGAWEKAMDAKTKAMGLGSFINISAPPCCLKCGSTDLEDLFMPEKKREKIRKQKEIARKMPERSELRELLMHWETRSLHRLPTKQVEKQIRTIGMRLGEKGGTALMYRVITTIEDQFLQNVVSSCWSGISGWQH